MKNKAHLYELEYDKGKYSEYRECLGLVQTYGTSPELAIGAVFPYMSNVRNPQRIEHRS